MGFAFRLVAGGSCDHVLLDTPHLTSPQQGARNRDEALASSDILNSKLQILNYIAL